MLIELMAVAHLATAAAVLNEHNTNNEQQRRIVNQRALLATQQRVRLIGSNIRILDEVVRANQKILEALVK